MKSLIRILFWFLGGLLAIVLGLMAQQIVIFATRSESSARIDAERDFRNECVRRGLDANEFKGPRRIKALEETYAFVWKNPSNGDQIATMVKYLPSGVESWFSPGSDNAEFTPYCDEGNRACQQ
jgi:hypothetical protein